VPFTLAIPVVRLAVGCAAQREPVDAAMLGGAAVVLASLALVMVSLRSRARSASSPGRAPSSAAP